MYKRLPIFGKYSIKQIWQGSRYASAIRSKDKYRSDDFTSMQKKEETIKEKFNISEFYKTLSPFQIKS